MRVIGVVSGKGGVGKTTLVANLGTTLVKHFGKSVAILDTNLSTPNLSMHFGLDYFSVTLREVLNKNVPILESVYIHPHTGLRIIPAPINLDKNHLKNLRKIIKLKKLIKKLNYDFIIADSSPGLGLEAVSTMKVVDEVIGVTTPDLPSVTDVSKALEIARTLGKDVLGVIVNRWNSGGLLVPDIEYLCGTHVISVIPEDLKVPISISSGTPVILHKEYAKASTEFKKIAAFLLGKTYKPSILERIKKMF